MSSWWPTVCPFSPSAHLATWQNMPYRMSAQLFEVIALSNPFKHYTPHCSKCWRRVPHIRRRLTRLCGSSTPQPVSSFLTRPWFLLDFLRRTLPMRPYAGWFTVILRLSRWSKRHLAGMSQPSRRSRPKQTRMRTCHHWLAKAMTRRRLWQQPQIQPIAVTIVGCHCCCHCRRCCRCRCCHRRRRCCCRHRCRTCCHRRCHCCRHHRCLRHCFCLCRIYSHP